MLAYISKKPNSTQSNSSSASRATSSTPKQSAKPQRKTSRKRSRINKSQWFEYKRQYPINAKYFKYITHSDNVKCKLCSNKTFWNGKNNRFSVLSEHKKIKHHDQWPPDEQEIETNAKPLLQLKKKSNEQQRKGLRVVFFCAFFIAMLMHAMSTLPLLVLFIHYFGVATTISYTTDGYRNDIFKSIAKTIRKKLDLKIKQSPFIAFSIDESTDNSILKNLILYICYFDFEIYESKECFIKLHEFDEEPDGKDIAEIVINIFVNEYGFEPNQIISGATDGASVMIGKYKGVIRYLCALYPYILPNHCISHRLELSVSDAFHDNKFYVHHIGLNH